jgi:hypothetical protein
MPLALMFRYFRDVATDLGRSLVDGLSEHGNECLGFINAGNFQAISFARRRFYNMKVVR